MLRVCRLRHRRHLRRVPMGAGFLLLVTVLLASPAAGQPAAPLFRVFLTDGTALASHGEWAHTAGRVVFSMPLGPGADADLGLVTLPEATVDWPRTEAYRARVRARHYAATRGPAEFDALSNEVARTLNEIALEKDADARLRRAERARRVLAEWPARHYGFKADEIHEFVATLDAIIGDIGAAAGRTRFDLALAAPPPSAEALLPDPDAQAVADQLLAAASASDNAEQRTSLLHAVLSLVEGVVDHLPATWASGVRKTVLGRLADERRIGQAYADLRRSAVTRAARLAGAADVRGLERLRADTLSKDASLGHKRPGEMTAVLQTLDIRLTDARRLRLARDQWELRAPVYEKYARAIDRPVETLDEARASLDAIRALAGPSPSVLQALSERFAGQAALLLHVAPPAGLASAHAALRSAWELATGAIRLRLDAVRANDLPGAREASAAAAGALMLLEHAKADLAAALEPPRLP